MRICNKKKLCPAVLLFISLLIFCLYDCSREEQEKERTKKAVTDESIGVLIQKSLDLEALQQYLHPEIEGREVLCISGIGLADKLKPYKGKPTIKIVDTASDCENMIRFDTIEVDRSIAHVVFSYDIEGIKGDIKFEFKDGQWIISSSRLIEK